MQAAAWPLISMGNVQNNSYSWCVPLTVLPWCVYVCRFLHKQVGLCMNSKIAVMCTGGNCCLSPGFMCHLWFMLPWIPVWTCVLPWWWTRVLPWWSTHMLPWWWTHVLPWIHAWPWWIHVLPWWWIHVLPWWWMHVLPWICVTIATCATMGTLVVCHGWRSLTVCRLNDS